MISGGGNVYEDIFIKGEVGVELVGFLGRGGPAMGGYLFYPKYEGGAFIPKNAGAGFNIGIGSLNKARIWHGFSFGVGGKSIVPAGLSHHRTWYTGVGIGNQGLIDSYKEGFNQYPVTIGPIGIGYFNSLPLR